MRLERDKVALVRRYALQCFRRIWIRGAFVTSMAGGSVYTERAVWQKHSVRMAGAMGEMGPQNKIRLPYMGVRDAIIPLWMGNRDGAPFVSQNDSTQ